ncbi:FHA domain-containing protein [Propionibacterium cyclohexanicum]|uniref:FHA domain-containing protein n=1 Tax=Propionibacterium cyclohexanicum TaxID=64702 RepID=A0A1H9SZF2_9ACTN|nr:FHA domain-containing protein [Propionibacterium cyclohexanicum]SER90410.1 FHA domain-containing protein [Propionibacterium cyclohexanicum]
MSAIVLATLKVAYLLLMWLFVLFVASTIRTDLFGRPVTAEDLALPGARRGRRIRRAEPQPPQLTRLVVTAGQRLGAEVPLEDEVTIGRSADSTLDIDDDYASSRHARLWRDAAGRWVLADLQSTNGTYVNGVKIEEPTVVGGEDVIRIGRSQLKLER